jgi:hypothetical protein
MRKVTISASQSSYQDLHRVARMGGTFESQPLDPFSSRLVEKMGDDEAKQPFHTSSASKSLSVRGTEHRNLVGGRLGYNHLWKMLKVNVTYRSSIRVRVWSHCRPSGTTTAPCRAQQASHQCLDYRDGQDCMGLRNVVSWHTVAAGRSSSEWSQKQLLPGIDQH